jgi:thiamine pyrophosphate-dependent acetolactate synthase large subunit-like protein
MNTTPTTVGSYVAQMLAANGIDTVFGVPGVHTIELYRGFEACGLRHVLVRHEQGAGFAADGYARASARPAGVFVISGPGVSNVLTAAAQAYSDSVPMLIVASSPVRAALGHPWGVLHELRDQHSLVASVLETALAAHSAPALRECLRTAFRALRGPRARPAYVQIPLDLLAERTDLTAECFADTTVPPSASSRLIDEACALLDGARRPLIIAGGGAKRATRALRQLTEALDAYLVTTAAGKGTVPEEHPAHLGASLPFRETQELIAEADVILAVGTELGESDIYSTTRLPMTGKLIRVDVDPEKISDHYGAAVGIRADAASTLEAMAGVLAPRKGWRSSAGAARAHRTRIEASFDARTHARWRALNALREALPAQALILTDMTQIAYLGNYVYPVELPGGWFHPSGYGTLGYALPAALGAKIAAPERPVLALAGDFGLQFTCNELATARELNLSLPIIVWNNGALGQIRDDMVAANIAPVAVVAQNPDFQALAAAYGAASARARSPDELTRAVRNALGRRGPTLIEAVEGDFLTA